MSAEWSHITGVNTVINLKLESWSAIAPGMVDADAWSSWLQQNTNTLPEIDTKLSLKQVPPLLRRRFTTLGKYAARAAFELLDEKTQLPKIFASRHGDTALTLSLLEQIARHEPISPTGFSLAVHNAVGGLISIARQDVASMTALASMDNLLLNTLYEAIAQLEAYPQVLCVIYDAPLPDVYQPYCLSSPFPFAVAFVLSHDNSTSVDLTMESVRTPESREKSQDAIFDFISLLLGHRCDMTLSTGKQTWRLALTQIV